MLLKYQVKQIVNDFFFDKTPLLLTSLYRSMYYHELL